MKLVMSIVLLMSTGIASAQVCQSRWFYTEAKSCRHKDNGIEKTIAANNPKPRIETKHFVKQNYPKKVLKSIDNVSLLKTIGYNKRCQNFYKNWRSNTPKPVEKHLIDFTEVIDPLTIEATGIKTDRVTKHYKSAADQFKGNATKTYFRSYRCTFKTKITRTYSIPDPTPPTEAEE